MAKPIDNKLLLFFGMQSKTKFFAAFLLIFSFLFGLFLVYSPGEVLGAIIKPEEPRLEEEWRDTSECVAKRCGSNEGTKEQTLYREVCEESCDLVPFSASREVVDVEGHYVCPEGYSFPEENVKCGSECGVKCYKEVTKYADEYYNWFTYSWECPISNHWYRSNNSSKACSKAILVETDAIWVESTFKTETFGPIDIPYILNSEDGVCEKPSFDSLDLPEWTEDAYASLPCGSDPEINCELQPTDESKIVNCTVDKVIECPAEGVCPTTCGHPKIEIPDGKGGWKTCPATAACVVADTPEVKGTTTVVLAKTAAVEKSSVYLIQSLLMLVTGASLIYVGREYLNRV